MAARTRHVSLNGRSKRENTTWSSRSLHMYSSKTIVRRFGPIAVALAAMPACNLICPYNADQFFETQIRAECHFFFACCTAGEVDILVDAGRFPNLSNFRDEATCVQERLEEGGGINFIGRAIVQAEQAGRFRFDYATAQLCLEGNINAMNNCDADRVIGDAAINDEVIDACEGVPGEGLVLLRLRVPDPRQPLSVAVLSRR